MVVARVLRRLAQAPSHTRFHCPRRLEINISLGDPHHKTNYYTPSVLDFLFLCLLGFVKSLPPMITIFIKLDDNDENTLMKI